MKRSAWLIIGALALVLVLWFALRKSGDEVVAVNLVEELPQATIARPAASVFTAGDVTIAGVTKPAIALPELTGSRLAYTVTVPDNGELRVSLGIREEGWTVEGDGVLFRVLLGAGADPEEIMNLVVNPYSNPADRSWQDIELDLSEYAGETVTLFFNTNSSPATRPPTDNQAGDLAVWGNPRIIAR